MAQRLIKNTPVLLLENGAFVESAMLATRVSRSNIVEKLRASGIGRLTAVRAMVLETTGDISVLSGEIDELMLVDVSRRHERAKE